MTTKAISAAVMLFCSVGSAVAEPCVSATFDTPLTGAVDVVTRYADVPSPQFPGLWQEGMLEGYFYTLYANGEGLLQSSRNAPSWEVKVTCTAEAGECSIKADGTPPENAQRLADVIAQCLQGRPTTEVAAPAPEPEEKAPCGVATVEAGPEGMVLQRLLVAAGTDPGPVDGFVGNGTRTALAEVLGASSRGLAIPDAIAALDKFMCE